jgi:transmembrane sensor
MDNFHELLYRYINRTATEDEKKEFFKLVASGRYDQIIISEDVREMIEADLSSASKEERELYESRERIYGSILKFNSISLGPKMLPMRSAASWIWYSAAAVLTISVVAFLWSLMRTEIATPARIAGQEKESTPGVYSGKQVVDLPDGTRVILNDKSELSFNPSFGESDRKVTLTGEASFDVTHDASRPFIVRTGKVNTRVLGTAFNISAYPEQSEITVTVLRGLVEVGDDQQAFGKVSPDQQIFVNKSTHDFVKKVTRAEAQMAWQSNFLILDDVTLEEAAWRIGEKFKVNIILENPGLKSCKFYGSFLNDESLTEILDMMSPVLHITYKIEDENVIVSGKGCN